MTPTYRILAPSGNKLLSFEADSPDEAITEAIEAIGRPVGDAFVIDRNTPPLGTRGGFVALHYADGTYTLVDEHDDGFTVGDRLVAVCDSADEGVDKGTAGIIRHIDREGKIDLEVPALIVGLSRYNRVWRPEPRPVPVQNWQDVLRSVPWHEIVIDAPEVTPLVPGTAVRCRYRGDHIGIVLAMDDPRAWAQTLAFPMAIPPPDLVTAHVAKHGMALSRERTIPVLYPSWIRSSFGPPTMPRCDRWVAQGLSA